MKCSDIKYGTFDCAYNIMLPYFVAGEEPTKYVCIDKCLLREILSLWEMGIKTTGCCCGHGNKDNAFIGVLPYYIPHMKKTWLQSVS